MNKVFLVGNLTRDPELRSTKDGIAVCTFNVAVNKRFKHDGEQEADFFRITAWRGLGENCAKYLAKGKKVSVSGSVSAQAYVGNDGQPHASLEVLADDIEFLSPKSESSFTPAEPNKPQEPVKKNDGFIVVDDGDGLPF